MARTPSSDNPCPQEEFIRQFAKMLDVTQHVEKNIGDLIEKLVEIKDVLKNLRQKK